MPFWPKRVSIFRLFALTTFIAASRELTDPPHPGPRPHRCSRSQRQLAPRLPSRRRRLRCPGAYYPGRILSAEQQVPSVFSEGLGTATSTTSCRTIEDAGEPLSGAVPMGRLGTIDQQKDYPSAL